MLINQRIKLTKMMIHQALIDLLLEKSLSDISITELCKNAEINRSTFYSHYSIVEDVLDEIEDEFLENVPFVDGAKNMENNKIKFGQFLKYISNNKDLFVILLQNGRIVNKVVSKSQDYFIEHNPIATKQQCEQYDHFINFSAYGTYYMLYQWVNNQGIYTNEEIGDIVLNLVLAVGNMSKQYLK